MRTGILTLALAWGATAIAQAPKKYALLVGVAKYNHADIAKLDFPEADARAVGDLLRGSGYEVDLLLGSSATVEAIRGKLKAFDGKGGAGGVALIGLFGHGVENPDTKESMFCPFDTRMRAVSDAAGRALFDAAGKPLTEPNPESLVGMRDMLAALAVAPAESRILMSDCCRSPPQRARALVGRDLSAFGQSFSGRDLPPNTSVVFGCSGQEKAFEHPDWQHGAFTKALLDEVAALPADQLNMGNLSFRVKERVSTMVREVAAGRESQTPRFFLSDGASLRLGSRSVAERALELLGPQRTRESAAQARKLLEAADGKDVSAKTMLGRMLCEGDAWTPIERRRGLALLESAADGGCAHAKLAHAFHESENPDADKQACAKRVLSALAGLGEAQGPLAGLVCCFRGQSAVSGAADPKNLAEARDWFRKGAALGDAMCMLKLGQLQLAPGGPEPNSADAVRHFRRGAELGHAQGMHNLGVCHQQGLGIARDSAEAALWFGRAAELGFSLSMRNLGVMNFDGAGVPRDFAAALKWFRKAAELGDTAAMSRIGAMHMEGAGVERDPAAAVAWFRKAAAAKDPQGMHNLAICYAAGNGVAQDTPEALRWLRKAAELGFPVSMEKLAECLERGNGLPQDLNEAILWYRKAAAVGSATAKQKLQQLGAAP